MLESKDIIVKSLEKARNEIRANMSSQGENASGRTSASFRVEDRGNKVVLVMGGDRTSYGKTAPLETLEIGSRPGIRGAWFKSVIHQWTIDKGMSFENESHRWAVSTVIARNIEEHGTARHRSPVNVYSAVVDDTMKEIRAELSQDFSQMMQTMVKSYIK